jgi:hypothetical protein
MDANDRLAQFGPTGPTVSLEGLGLDHIAGKDLEKIKDARKLLLSGNRLTSFQPVVANCPNLTYLIADMNQIKSFVEIQRLATIPSLRSLSLVENPITDDEGYRSFVTILLPGLQVLDGSPLTAEEKTAAGTYCRRNFSTLPTLVENKTSISLFQSMINDLKAQTDATYDSEVALRNLAKTDYKSLWRAANLALQPNLPELQHIWSLEIIEDVELIADDMKQNDGTIDYAMDRAFLELLQLQLSRIQELKDKVDGMISDRNSLVELLSKDPNLAKESVTRRIFSNAPFIINQRSVTKSHKSDAQTPLIAYSNLKKNKSNHLEGGTPFVESPTSRQSPSPIRRGQNKFSTETEGQARIDSLVDECQAKDTEIGVIIAHNLNRESNLRDLDERASQMRLKLSEMNKLEEIKEKLKLDLVRNLPSQTQLERSIEQANRVEEDIDRLKTEIGQLQADIKACIEEETNEEMADDLRKYHLKIKFFIGVRDYLHQKRIEAVVDDFRGHQLQRKLFKSLNRSSEEDKKLKLVADKIQLDLDKDWNEELAEQKIAEQFQKLRAIKWRAFYFGILEEHKDYRLESESLKAEARKMYERKLVAKSLKAFKKELNLYRGDVLAEEKLYQLKIRPQVEVSRLHSAWNAWKTIFAGELKPLFVKRKQVEAMSGSRRKAAALRRLQIYAQSAKGAHQELSLRHQKCVVQVDFKAWRSLALQSVKKQEWVSRRIAYERLRIAFRSLKAAVREQQIITKAQALEEAKMLAAQKTAEERETVDKQKQETIEKQTNSVIDKFRMKWTKKTLFDNLKNAAEVKASIERIEDLKTSRELKVELEDIESQMKDEALERRLEEGLPAIRQAAKQAKKGLLLTLWREASLKSKLQKSKVNSVQTSVQTHLLRKAFRGLKKLRLASILTAIRHAEKHTMINEERNKKDHRNITSTQNESEFISTEISHLEVTLRERAVDLEASVAANKKLQDAIASLQLATDLAEQEAIKKAVEAENLSYELESRLAERKLKVASLERELQDALEEVKALDTRIEGRQLTHIRGKR